MKIKPETTVEAAHRGRKSAWKLLNRENAERAKTALRSWIPPNSEGFDVDKLETDILGLMDDLLHFTHQSKMDVQQLMDLAKINFDLETEK